MGSLFNISEEYLRLIDELEESGGEITEELAARLDITQSQLEDKIKAYRYMILLREAEIKVATDEKSRINSRQSAKKNAVERLKKAISVAVDLFGTVPPKKSYKALIYKDLSVYNKETESLQIVDTTIIPDKYISRTITIPQSKLELVKKLLDEQGILNYTISPNLVLDNDTIKETIQSDNELLERLTADEQREFIESGRVFGVPGAVLNKNLTPVFS